MEERDLDMVGSQIWEFVKDPEHPVAASTLPVSSDEIVAYSKKRILSATPMASSKEQGHGSRKLQW